MRLTLLVQNLGHGALYDGNGNPDYRWPAVAEAIRALPEQPDLVLFQEAVDWGRWGHKHLAQAMHDLDMDAPPLPPSSSGYGPALLYRKETVGRWLNWNPDFAHKVTHGFGVATFDVGLPTPLAVISAHLDPHSAEIALAEAKYIATRAMRYGPYGIVAGDLNYPPAQGPSADFSAMRPYNLAARTMLPADASQVGSAPVPDRRIGLKMMQTGFVDAAWHLYEKTGDPALLARTGTDDRIDQCWVSGPLAPAIVSYRTLDMPSDHKGLLVQIDPALADTTNVWEYR
ncbi:MULTISPECIES: endonuclease/exonuclease/phosphatase family protein [unclassified Kitasatospora]|uniref:endonuclease/exonuclease/phosphatase family protein n=1 Tax=unclassified Kitasatospora TaxID=2633591 RepID=UPI00070FB474|nr:MULTISPECIES: endonuclease/exonuclease/phosphatase family protein [unclassified Kitasatospora]KQV20829.1 hypothetical protein ASC99_20180 [Kitasatospora sp. Root107]KRB60514.1 hypothetical protein ASE03_12995 [Kitasatospora sp. Root187]